MLLLTVLVAGGLRLVSLDVAPPGFYRDEGQNGLDALDVLAGEHALYFPENNGREPAYIYLTALSVALLGRIVPAVRLAAAVVGTLTTIPLFLLARSWFGWRVGLLAAWLWAVTLWPVHLSRIGFRVVLLAPLLALVFWLGTLAYRRRQAWLWAAAGVVYGLCFYTYLAARFTPLLLGVLLVYLLWRQETRRRLWPGVLWFGLGAGLVLAPLAILAAQQPDVILGRTGQVSILNPAVNGGDLWGTLARQVARTAGMYFWQGDTIWRHNPAGRPVFDWVMAIPFLIGVVVAGRRWRQPAMFALLAWQVVMLGPTILAEDAPHFLRVAGVLPTILIIPALGLSKLMDWPTLRNALHAGSPAGGLEDGRQSGPRRWRVGLISLLCVATLVVTVRDYFGDYVQRAETAFYFEAAARDLAEMVSAEAAETDVFLDERYGPGAWPAIAFLIDPVTRPVTLYTPQDGLPCPATCIPPFAVYAWPYTSLDYIPAALPDQVLVRAEAGSLARGDRETEAYPFFHWYRVEAFPPEMIGRKEVNFDQRLVLHDSAAQLDNPMQPAVTLRWAAPGVVEQPLAAYVHVVDENGQVLAQSDAPPGGTVWPHTWWTPGRVVEEVRHLRLPVPFDRERHTIVVGVYEAATGDRLPVINESGAPAGDSWPVPIP